MFLHNIFSDVKHKSKTISLCRSEFISGNIDLRRKSSIRYFLYVPLVLVNKIEDFCEKVEGKDVCFDFDIKDKHRRSRYLKGCVKVTKPKEVDLGCFRLPLLDNTGYDVTGSEMERESESEMYDDEALYFQEY